MSAGKSKKRGTHKTHKPPLSVRDIRFCQKIVAGDDAGNVTIHQAYLDAGFPEKPTRNATYQAAARLVRTRKIRDYIRELQHVASAAAKVTVEEITAGIANIAKADRRTLFDKKGRILPPDQWPDDVAATIEGIETEEIFETVSDGVDEDTGKKKPKRKELVGYSRKVKTGSRLAAWNKLAEIKRMTGQDKRDDAGKESADKLVIEGEL